VDTAEDIGTVLDGQMVSAIQFEKGLVGGSPAISASVERHYSPAEIAEMWNLSSDKVRKLFEREAGVLVIRNEERQYSRRSYKTLRIPQSVLERVHRRMSKV
jgi:hypothetical protein